MHSRDKNWISEIFLTQDLSSALSYHPTVTYPSANYRTSASFLDTSLSHHGSYASSMNITSPDKTHLREKGGPVTHPNVSYSAAAKKAGDIPQVFRILHSSNL